MDVEGHLTGVVLIRATGSGPCPTPRKFSSIVERRPRGSPQDSSRFLFFGEVGDMYEVIRCVWTLNDFRTPIPPHLKIWVSFP